MTKSFFIFLILLCSGLTGVAADQYLIYHVNKPVQWLHDGKKETAKRGVYIKPQQSIIIADQNEVMLIQNDGKSLLITKPGTYSFLQIKKLFSALKTNSSSSGFFAYVFDKFLHGDGDDEKQKVSAAVFRGPKEMQLPLDSSFVFSTPILKWKSKNINIPYKIELKINGVLFDTIVRKQSSFVIPGRLLKTKDKSPSRIEWICYAADRKQKPPFFLLLIPKKEDELMIQQQIKGLKNSFKTNYSLYKIFEKDLLERWLEVYQLK